MVINERFHVYVLGVSCRRVVKTGAVQHALCLVDVVDEPLLLRGVRRGVHGLLAGILPVEIQAPGAEVRKPVVPKHVPAADVGFGSVVRIESRKVNAASGPIDFFTESGDAHVVLTVGHGTAVSVDEYLNEDGAR